VPQVNGAAESGVIEAQSHTAKEGGMKRAERRGKVSRHCHAHRDLCSPRTHCRRTSRRAKAWRGRARALRAVARPQATLCNHTRRTTPCARRLASSTGACLRCPSITPSPTAGPPAAAAPRPRRRHSSPRTTARRATRRRGCARVCSSSRRRRRSTRPRRSSPTRSNTSSGSAPRTADAARSTASSRSCRPRAGIRSLCSTRR
jgi:hypothetical protein